MIAPASPAVTLWLSVLLGAFLLAGGIGMWAGGQDGREMLAELERSPALLAIGGVVAFAIGAVVVSIHNVWTDPAAVFVSAAGWLAVAEGLVLLALPELWLRLARRVIGASRIFGVALLLAGAFLLSSAAVRPLDL